MHVIAKTIRNADESNSVVLVLILIRLTHTTRAFVPIWPEDKPSGHASSEARVRVRVRVRASSSQKLLAIPVAK